MVKYEFSPSLQALMEDIVKRLFPHIGLGQVKCYKSEGGEFDSSIVGRCHSLGKIMQEAFNVNSFYALEFVRDKFNDLSTEEKAKMVIRELMYISNKFDGGFREGDFIREENIELAYRDYLDCRKNGKSMDWFKERGFS